MASVLRIGVRMAPNLTQYEIQNYNGTKLHVFFAKEIRLICQILHLRYDLIPAEDEKLGNKEADGNWSGLLGMAVRSEVDAVFYPLEITAVPKNVHFSYPYGITDQTFMTNKPESVSKSLAIVHPFSYSMWIALAIILIVLPIIFYILLNRKVKYQTVLFDVFGNLLEQSSSFYVKRHSTRIFLTGWLLGVMIISYGYKAMLLSALSIPRTTVIRDIPDLVRAATEGSVECFDNLGSGHRYFTASDIMSWRKIGGCLKKQEYRNFNDFNFYNCKCKRILIGSRHGLSFDEKFFYVSEDSFKILLYSFLFSKSFCCRKKFDVLINQLRAAGLDKKFDDEEKFLWQYYLKGFHNESSPSTPSGKILLNDVSGCFYILISGWISAFLTLVGEIFTEKYIYRRK